MAFTDYYVSRLKPGPRRRIITETGVPPDLRGLQLWLYPGGTRSWFFRYKLLGRTSYLKIGDYPIVTLAEAHEAVLAARRQVKAGLDPVGQQRAQRSANLAAPTVEAVYHEFRDQYLRKERRRPEQAEDIIENHVLPRIGDLKAQAITRRTLIELVREVESAGGPRIAAVVRGLLVQMFNSAEDYDLIPASPAARLPFIGTRGNTVTRVLTTDEIRQLWQGLPATRITLHTQLAIKLLLLTGQRRQEVALAQWAHVDLDAGTWLIPAEHSKNGRAHLVPLSREALAVVEAMAAPVTAGRPQSSYLVPSRLVKDQPIGPGALTTALARYWPQLAAQRFTPHDLRRTVATGMKQLRVAHEHVGHVLNHTVQGITARYDHADYLVEKRAALAKWGRHVAKTVDASR